MGLRNDVHRFTGNGGELVKDHIHSLVRLTTPKDGYRYQCKTCGARLKRKSGVMIDDLNNLRLQTAAPDLLEALREIVSLTDRKHNVWDKARAAIAKAEGHR